MNCRVAGSWCSSLRAISPRKQRCQFLRDGWAAAHLPLFKTVQKKVIQGEKRLIAWREQLVESSELGTALSIFFILTDVPVERLCLVCYSKKAHFSMNVPWPTIGEQVHVNLVLIFRRKFVIYSRGLTSISTQDYCKVTQSQVRIFLWHFVKFEVVILTKNCKFWQYLDFWQFLEQSV